MILGPFLLTEGRLSVTEVAGIDAWEEAAEQVFSFQKYAPWWIGDMIVYGEAMFGDDVWQAIPEGFSIDMIERFVAISRKIPPEDRVLELSWTHHVSSLKICNPVLRKAFLRKAARDGLDNKQFLKLLEREKASGN